MKWIDGQIQIIPPKKPKKLTATRFATILGLNPWSTPFEVWCSVTRTYEVPFEDTKYTIAGKAIEPKQAQYIKDSYLPKLAEVGISRTLVSPTDLYGEDYFKKTYGYFFGDNTLNGMWDYLLHDKDGNPCSVLEMKTTGRSEDWAEDIPEYYALQAALYAYLLGVDDVIMVASFLEAGDYDDPSNFECQGSNTITRPFKVSERYPDFEKRYVKPALKWWKDHVESGISPTYDEKKDAEILAVLRTNNLSPETDLAALVEEAERLKALLDLKKSDMEVQEKRYKIVTDMIKKAAIAQFRDGDKKVSIPGAAYSWEVSLSSTVKIDKDAMKKDGVLEKYSTTEETYRLLPKEMKEDK